VLTSGKAIVRSRTEKRRQQREKNKRKKADGRHCGPISELMIGTLDRPLPGFEPASALLRNWVYQISDSEQESHGSGQEMHHRPQPRSYLWFFFFIMVGTAVIGNQEGNGRDPDRRTGVIFLNLIMQ